MTQGMKEIKRTIKSVSSTKEITMAMELVSSAKLKKARKQLESLESYKTIVLDSFKRILSSLANLSTFKKAENREFKKLFIVIASDRGLAGGYNSNILKLVENTIEDKENALIIPVGQKGIDYFLSKDYVVSEKYLLLGEEPKYEDAAEIGKIAVDLYRHDKVDEINLAFTKFENALSHIPAVIKLFPLEELKDKEKERRNFEFEPSPQAVMEYMILKYVQSAVYCALVEASASEQASRRMSMESATNNAEKMISELEMGYNRARQAYITREIAEIVGGSEALNK